MPISSWRSRACCGARSAPRASAAPRPADCWCTRRCITVSCRCWWTGAPASRATRDAQGACRVMEELDNGITYVNAPTIGAEAHLPFGGIKGTGNGHREVGWQGYEFFSETKVVYVDYSGKLQRAQIDTYDV